MLLLLLLLLLLLVQEEDTSRPDTSAEGCLRKLLGTNTLDA